MSNQVHEMLAQIADPEQRKGLQKMVDHQIRTRAAYGYDTPEGVFPEPLTLAQMKAGEIRNAQALAERVVREHAGKRDLDDWFDVWHHERATHNRDLPEFAFLTIMANCWTDSEERHLAQCAWTLPEWPGQIGREHWLLLCNKVGFICTVVDDEGGCPLHQDEFDQQGDGEPITVWRGSFTGFKRGLSWTTDRDRAVWFARRGDMAGKGRTMHLWRCEVPPERVEAHYNTRSEHEIVADVRGLKIIEEKP